MPVELSSTSGRPLSQTYWPWRQVRWWSMLSPAECAARLIDTAGMPSGMMPTVVLVGNSFRVSLDRRGFVYGRPYLSGAFINSRGGTLIVGRFNPDPFTIASVVVAFWCVGLLLSGLLTVGARGLLWVLFSFAEHAPTAILLAAIPIVLTVGGLRARGWRTQCDTMSGLMRSACNGALRPPDARQ